MPLYVSTTNCIIEGKMVTFKPMRLEQGTKYSLRIEPDALYDRNPRGRVAFPGLKGNEYTFETAYPKEADVSGDAILHSAIACKTGRTPAAGI